MVQFNVQKWPEPGVFFDMLTSTCALCHNGARFFDILTSKSALRPPVCFTFDFEICFAPQRRPLFSTSQIPKVLRHRCFVHFDLEMCFAPHWRALFQHFTFQKCSGVGVFCTFFHRFSFEMCFAPQPRAIFHLSCPQMAPHPPL